VEIADNIPNCYSRLQVPPSEVFEKIAMDMTDREGISVFYKDKNGDVFHTYSTYARGIDMVNPTYQFLDLVPKGRDEHGRRQYWVRYQVGKR
jgi:predicted dithiol-disulfide oxidoreductase (DUF899 family)